jgi:hypothetical protein
MTIKKYNQIPLLARFEELIDNPEIDPDIIYNHEEMLATKDNIPLVLQKNTHLQGVTRHTRVTHETQDDN